MGMPYLVSSESYRLLDAWEIESSSLWLAAGDLFTVNEH